MPVSTTDGPLTASFRTNQPRHRTHRSSRDLVVDCLRHDGPASQAAVARRTGLSRAAVNAAVAGLRQEGLVQAVPVNGREDAVSLIAGHGRIVAVSVSLRSVRGALFDLDRRRRTDVVREVPSEEPRASTSPDMAVQVVRELCETVGIDAGELKGLAVAVQAPIDRHTGAIATWSTGRLPHWRDVAIAPFLAAELGTVVLADNDANLAALAEWSWGAGGGSRDFLFVKCSAAVGGGLIIDGEIYGGGTGMAGEFGHVVVEPGGEVCFCGSRGCLSTLASERSLLAALQDSGSVRRSLTEIIHDARRGDPACQRVIAEAGRYLGRALADTAKLLAPSVIAVGGDLSRAGNLLFESIRASIEVSNLQTLSPTVRFAAAHLVEDSELLGGLDALLGVLGRGMSELPEWMRAPFSS